MGLLGLLFGRSIDCPACRTPGARQGIFSGLKCPSESCMYYDFSLDKSAGMDDGFSDRSSPSRRPSSAKSTAMPPLELEQGPHTIRVSYVNFEGEHKTFVGDRRTLRKRNAHYSLRVGPSSRRIALKAERIQNRAEVEQATPAEPNTNEKRVLTRHRTRGTTSSQYQQLQQKYPEWAAGYGQNDDSYY